jgi:hypothetical protein
MLFSSATTEAAVTLPSFFFSVFAECTTFSASYRVVIEV